MFKPKPISRVRRKNYTSFKINNKDNFKLEGNIDINILANLPFSELNIPEVYKVDFNIYGKLESRRGVFKDCRNLQLIKFDYKTLKDLDGENFGVMLFMNCKNLEAVKGLQFVKNLQSTSSMFKNCTSLKYIDRKVSFSKVVNMSNMFANCHSLGELDMHSWSVKELCTIESAFENCYSLHTIKLPKLLKLANIITSKRAFSGCKSLIDLKIELGRRQYLLDCSNMFSDSVVRGTLDITDMCISNATKVDDIFNNAFINNLVMTKEQEELLSKEIKKCQVVNLEVV